MQNSDAPDKKAETTSARSNNPAASEAPEPTIRVSLPGKPDVLIRLSGLHASLDAAEQFRKPKSIWQLLKEYLPIVTPLAAVFVSSLAFYYTRQFNARTAASSASETIGKLISEAGQDLTDKQKRVEAMKIAAYGDQGLNAVKMALAEDDLRDEGAKVAQQMYRTGAVDRSNLTKKMLCYYDNPILRLGVVQWLKETGEDLEQRDRAAAMERLMQSFHADGDRCAELEQQSKGVSLETAKVLLIWPKTSESQDFAGGLAAHCSSDVKTQLGPLLKGN